jgi:hypothetical protein
MIAFIDDHRDVHGVEPICRLLQVAPSTYYAYVAQRDDPTKASAMSRRDAELSAEIKRVFEANLEVYGARKIWRQLGREGVRIARCTVERLMRRLGIQGAVRGKKAKTTISDKATPCPADRVNRQFQAPRPNVLWVSDFTYVSTWQGFVYTAFVIDAFARRIVGWRVSSAASAGFVLDALEQALHERRPVRRDGLIHHSDRGVQGGLNRSSQQPDAGGCDDEEEAALGQICTGGSALAGPAAGWATRAPTRVLVGDRGRAVERGRRGGCRGITSRGNQVVPGGRRHATIAPCTRGEAAVGAIPLLHRA